MFNVYEPAFNCIKERQILNWKTAQIVEESSCHRAEANLKNLSCLFRDLHFSLRSCGTFNY